MEIPSGSGHTPFEAALHYQTLAFMQEVGPRFKPEWLNSDCPGGGRWVVESTGAVSQGPRPIGLAKPVWEEGQVKCFGPQGEHSRLPAPFAKLRALLAWR